jgi:preprotein translocase subunit YajC
LASLLLLIVIFGAGYFFFIRPRAQAARRQRETLTEIGVGDEVLTGAGIFGRVLDVESDRVTLETAPGTRITVLRSTIARRLTGRAGESMQWDEHDEAEAHAAYTEEDWHEDGEPETASDDDRPDASDGAYRGHEEGAPGDAEDEPAEAQSQTPEHSPEQSAAEHTDERDEPGPTPAQGTETEGSRRQQTDGGAADGGAADGCAPSPDTARDNGAAGRADPANGPGDRTRSARSAGGRRGRRPDRSPRQSGHDSEAS